MNTSVVQISSKGQITLPVKIRKKFPQKSWVVFDDGEKVQMKPLDLEKLSKEKSEDSFWLEATLSDSALWDEKADKVWDNV